VASRNDYVLQVKKNQPNLYKSIKETISSHRCIDYDYSLEKSRSRIESREVYLYEPTDNPCYNCWPGLKYIIYIKSYGTRKSKPYEEHKYYITSRNKIDACHYNQKIRNHWRIENNLHWVKDVIMNEDKGLIKGMKLSENVSILRNIVINLFRLNGESSIKYAFDKYCNRINDCYLLMNLKHI